jgi:hypothetical protein
MRRVEQARTRDVLAEGRARRAGDGDPADVAGALPLSGVDLVGRDGQRPAQPLTQRTQLPSCCDVVPFIGYGAQGYVDGLREQLAFIRAQQLEVTWENYVHSRFRGRDTTTSSRRKHLVLDMPVEPVSRNETRRISPRMAEAYANKTGKTISRDLNALRRMGLIRDLGSRRYQANRVIIRAFLPPQAEQAPLRP